MELVYCTGLISISVLVHIVQERWQQHLQGVDYRAKEAPDPRLLSMTCGPIDELNGIAKL